MPIDLANLYFMDTLTLKLDHNPAEMVDYAKREFGSKDHIFIPPGWKTQSLRRQRRSDSATLYINGFCPLQIRLVLE